MTGGVILAAGMSSRMQTYKPLLKIAGKEMIQWSVEHMLSGGVEQIVVVTGYNHHLLSDYIKAQWDGAVQTVFNPQYSNGKMFDSVRTGLSQIKGCEEIFLTLADMPAIAPASYIRLKQELKLNDKKIIIPVVNNKRCHPPLISADMIDQILRYKGPDGLRGFWKEWSADVAELELTDQGCTMDADKREDLQQLEAHMLNQFYIR